MFIKPMLFPWFSFVNEQEEGGSPKPGDDLGFPADTPVEEMTAEQQLAYWKNDAEKWKTLSKKHEKNRKPKDFDSIASDAQKWREKQDESLEPDEKAVKVSVDKARAEGRSEGISALLTSAVRAEFKSRAPHLSDDELDELIEDIDVTPERFYVDDELDTDRIERLAKKLAPAPDKEQEDDSDEPRWGLGHVMRGGQRQKGKGPSIDEIRAQTLAEFKTQK